MNAQAILRDAYLAYTRGKGSHPYTIWVGRDLWDSYKNSLQTLERFGPSGEPEDDAPQLKFKLATVRPDLSLGPIDIRFE